MRIVLLIPILFTFLDLTGQDLIGEFLSARPIDRTNHEMDSMLSFTYKLAYDDQILDSDTVIIVGEDTLRYHLTSLTKKVHKDESQIEIQAYNRSLEHVSTEWQGLDSKGRLVNTTTKYTDENAAALLNSSKSIQYRHGHMERVVENDNVMMEMEFKDKDQKYPESIRVDLGIGGMLYQKVDSDQSIKYTGEITLPSPDNPMYELFKDDLSNEPKQEVVITENDSTWTTQYYEEESPGQFKLKSEYTRNSRDQLIFEKDLVKKTHLRTVYTENGLVSEIHNLSNETKKVNVLDNEGRYKIKHEGYKTLEYTYDEKGGITLEKTGSLGAFDRPDSFTLNKIYYK